MVHRLAGFFREAQNTLAQLASRQRQWRASSCSRPARTTNVFRAGVSRALLGYMLVEGQDLTVRDNHVWLKTLSGLERVDVILRRVDDDFATRSNCATTPCSACRASSRRCARAT